MGTSLGYVSLEKCVVYAHIFKELRARIEIFHDPIRFLMASSGKSSHKSNFIPPNVFGLIYFVRNSS